MPQVLYLVIGKDNIVSGDNSFIQPRIGWMADSSTGSVKYPSENPSLFEESTAYKKFLWINFGVILPMFVIAAFWGLRKRIKHENIKLFILGGILFFMLVQLFKFQPWDYDNNKLLLYFQFFAAPVLIFFFMYLMQLWKKVGLALLIIFFVLVIHSGVVDIIPRALVPIEHIPTVFNTDAIEMAAFVRQNIPEDAQIMTGSTHLNIVSSLAGRPSLVGYPGWLWTKGVDYSPRENDLKTFYTNPDRADILKKYNVQYILLDSQVIYDWKADKSAFDARFKKIYGDGNLVLYKVMGL